LVEMASEPVMTRETATAKWGGVVDCGNGGCASVGEAKREGEVATRELRRGARDVVASEEGDSNGESSGGDEGPSDGRLVVVD
jgi:hypothetical protein